MDTPLPQRPSLLSERLARLDWIGLVLWVFRALIIVLVIYGTVAKIFLDVGTQYTGRQ